MHPEPHHLKSIWESQVCMRISSLYENLMSVWKFQVYMRIPSMYENLKSVWESQVYIYMRISASSVPVGCVSWLEWRRGVVCALRAHCSGQQQRLRSTTTFSFSQEGRQCGHDLVMSPSTRYFIAFLCIYIPLYLWHNKLKRTHHTSQLTSRKEFRKFFDFQKDLTAKLLARESLNLL